MQNFTFKGFMKLQTYLDSYVAIQLSFLVQKTNEIKLHLNFPLGSILDITQTEILQQR